jgi:DNA-binding response OmpR family regulator
MEPTVKTSSARVRMGSFEVDLRSGELHSLASDGAANKAVRREQPFQVLPMLVEREGKIVTRREIKKRLWPNDTTVDHDHIINVAIRSRRSHNWKFTNRSRNMPSNWEGDARFHWLENRSESPL